MKLSPVFLPVCITVFCLLSCARTGLEPELPAHDSPAAEAFNLPLYSSRDYDLQAADLFISAKEASAVSEKRALLTQALALAGISRPVRAMLEKELSLAVEPPKAPAPRTSFQAVSIPRQKTSSRYGVNMSELMKTVNEAGITKDPFAQ